MKRITFIFLIGILFVTTSQAQNKKEIRFEKEFQKTLALVNSDQFTVKFYIATPPYKHFSHRRGQVPTLTLTHKIVI